MADTLARYLFEDFPARCLIVRLERCWLDCHQHCDYPAPARDLLGQTLAISALMAAGLKFDGRLTLQVTGGKHIAILVTQATDQLGLRGMVKLADDFDAGNPLLETQIVVSTETGLKREGGPERYQGVVPTTAGSIAENFEAYFRQSEQLPTRFWLAANQDAAVGLMLQQLPSVQEEIDSDGWTRVLHLAETLKDDELLYTAPDTLIHRLFHQENLRELDQRHPHFQCGCGRERVAGMIAGLGQKDAAALLEEAGQISVTCEFCNRVYAFDAVDTAQIFATEPVQPASTTRQ